MLIIRHCKKMDTLYFVVSHLKRRISRASPSSPPRRSAQVKLSSYHGLFLSPVPRGRNIKKQDLPPRLHSRLCLCPTQRTFAGASPSFPLDCGGRKGKDYRTDRKKRPRQRMTAGVLKLFLGASTRAAPPASPLPHCVPSHGARRLRSAFSVP